MVLAATGVMRLVLEQVERLQVMVAALAVEAAPQVVAVAVLVDIQVLAVKVALMVVGLMAQVALVAVAVAVPLVERVVVGLVF